MDIGILTRAPMQPLMLEASTRPALSLEREEMWTYAQLHTRSNEYANALLALGATAGDRIGILLFNSLEYCALYFASVKIGCIAVRLNFRLQAPELDYALNDSGCTILCVHDELLSTVAPIWHRVPVQRAVVFPHSRAADTLPPWAMRSEALGRDPSDPDIPQPRESDIAMLMYTSGTTGRPKAAAWTHANTLWFAAMQAINWKYDPGVKALTTGPLYHCGSFEDLVLPALLVGGHAVITKSRNFSIHRIVDVIASVGITDALLYPSMIYDLLKADVDGAMLGSVRRIVTGGSAIAPSAVLELRRRWPNARLTPAYGLTEGGSIVTALPDDLIESSPESVGKPFPLTEVRIVRDDGPDGLAGEIGEEGEIWARSPAVAQGYWANTEATRETFIDGWCRTGDVGRVDDGLLVIRGRKNDMIKSGGENVYPVEVEAALTEHPAIGDAAVFGVPDERLQEAVCAIVVRVADGDANAADITAFCRDRIAGYKVPRHVRFVDQIPRNAAGKVLKSELRDLFVRGALDFTQGDNSE